MTRDEWSGVCAILAANWPTNVPPDFALAKWYGDLADLPAEQVVASVEALARDGREFPPNGGMIRKRALELASDFPTWSAVWFAISTAVSRHGHWNDVAALRDLDALHPLVGRLAREITWRHLCLCEDGITTLEAQCRNKYTALVQRHERDALLVGLPSGGLRAIERANGPVTIGEAVRQLAPAEDVA